MIKFYEQDPHGLPELEGKITQLFQEVLGVLRWSDDISITRILYEVSSVYQYQ